MARESAEGKELAVSKLDELKAEIEKLPTKDFVKLASWLSKKDWERWDKRVETDSRAGKLDFLAREAREGKSKGTLADL